MSRISVIGNVNVDLIVWPAAELPPPGTDLPVESIQTRAAGAAGNTALALAQLGTIPRLVGCVGDDHYGRMTLNELAAAGIKEGVFVLPGEPTGISIAFQAPKRDRSFLTLLGSLQVFEASIVPPDALERDFVLLCGYFSLPSLQGRGTLGLLEKVRATGGCTLFDCGWDPAGWPQETRREIAELLSLVDVFLPNEVEARGLTGIEDPVAAARTLQRISGGWVIVKLGPQGCIAVGPGQEHQVAAPSVQATDTTGAGDAFNAGLLYALSDGTGLPEALRLATRLATTVVSRPSGNRYPAPGELLPLSEDG
jgi:sugar/nucleoside kinase (ribokinase family)